MNNKLNELSKPVAWFTDDYLTDTSATTYSEQMAQRWREKPWFVGKLYSQEYVSALLAELEREQVMRAQNLEIKTLLAEKVKALETKLWDSQQLVDAKSGSQIELRSQISSLEESNRKDMAWRGERLCELENSLEAAQKRISELEATLSEMTTFRDNALTKNMRCWEEVLELRAKLATPVRFPDCDIEAVSIMAHWLSDEEVNAWVKGIEFAKQQVRAAGFTVEGDDQ